ncbi:MAG: hypothetical protein M3T96_08290 [Acidobacteriota bacterium]|nr:hypothetical protein [Acidobacteriota bacterium]
MKEVPVDVPKVESAAPIIVRLCPEILTKEQRSKVYWEHGYPFFSKEKAVNCEQVGGGGGGGGYLRW